MDKKNVTVSIMIVAIIAFGIGLWYQTSHYTETKEVAISERTQGWKTYISSYGFSISYPKDWYLKEDADPRSGKEGYRPFEIYNHDVDNQLKGHSAGEPWVLISVAVYNGASKGIDRSLIPSDPFEKVIYLAKGHKFYVGEKNRVIKRLNMDYTGCLISYRGDKPNSAIFYMPDRDALLFVDLESESWADEYLLIVQSIRRENAGK